MKKMNRSFILLTLIFVLLCTIYPCLEARADVINVPKLSISQIFEYSGKEYQDNELVCSYELKGKNGNEPLPEGYSGSFGFTLNGTDNLELNILLGDEASKGKYDIRYTALGIYEYKLKQERGSGSGDVTRDYKLDTTEYTVRVYIINGDDGISFGCIEVVDGNGEKPSQVEFQNEYIGNKFNEPPSDKNKAPDATVKNPFGDGEKSIDGPLTGDEIALITILVLMGAALVGGIVVVIIKKKTASETIDSLKDKA